MIYKWDKNYNEIVKLKPVEENNTRVSILQVHFAMPQVFHPSSKKTFDCQQAMLRADRVQQFHFEPANSRVFLFISFLKKMTKSWVRNGKAKSLMAAKLSLRMNWSLKLSRCLTYCF